MDPSAYDDELIQIAIHNLDLAGVDLTTDQTLTIRDRQGARKWGSQPQPLLFKQAYTERLSLLHDGIGQANEEVHALRDSLFGIQQDASDATASSIDLANQIAANRNAIDQPTTTM